VPLNFRKSLLPSGGGWRGSTLEGDSFQGMYDDKFGSKLQVYRIFKGAGWAALSDDMKSFIKVCAAPPAPKPCPHGRSVALGEPSARRCSLQSGGIIFYSIHDLDWADIASGKKDWALQDYVNVFKEIAPAKMFVCSTFECASTAQHTAAQHLHDPNPSHHHNNTKLS
jgi:hypothetical protein